jgi:uncharacterized protein YukE
MSAREDEIRQIVAELDAQVAEVEARLAALKALLATMKSQRNKVQRALRGKTVRSRL